MNAMKTKQRSSAWLVVIPLLLVAGLFLALLSKKTMTTTSSAWSNNNNQADLLRATASLLRAGGGASSSSISSLDPSSIHNNRMGDDDDEDLLVAAEAVAEFENDNNNNIDDKQRLLQQVDDETLRRYHADPTGYRRHPTYYSDKYLVRANPPPNQAALDEEWGKWTLVDEKRATRPGDDFYAAYPHRDVPWTDLPDATAWQKDATYLPQFLEQSLALTERAMEAILTEYGWGKDRDTRPFDERILELSKGSVIMGNSTDGLERRVLHAIVTEDTFVLGMAGHSAAAGHGNHFQQSYTHAYGSIMEPIFARLGVFSSSRNYGAGGMGTLQVGMATAPLMGKDVDVLVWDSGMTEHIGPQSNMLAIQAILGMDRVPYLIEFGARGTGESLFLHDNVGMDMEHSYNAAVWAPKIETPEQNEAMPWAAQCQNIAPALNSICPRAYRGTCWINRTGFVWGGEDMSFTPTNTKQKEPSGRAGWHPGDKVHQITGRALAGRVLIAMRNALLKWKNSPGLVLADEDWHVTEYYEKTRTALKTTGKEIVMEQCTKLSLPARYCLVPMQGASEFARYDAARTNIRRLFKVNASPMKIRPAAYDPPDVYNPNLHPPEGALDVLQIVENGVSFAPNFGRIRRRDSLEPVDFTPPESGSSVNPAIQPGKGWALDNSIWGGHDMCDGEYYSWCRRDNANPCMLYAHNDARWGLFADSFSGWGIFELPNMREGLIVIKIHDWTGPNANMNTIGWTTENGAPESAQRDLKGYPPTCDDFEFEFAIDGKITTWDKTKYTEELRHIERVVQVLVLMDDPNYVKNGETKNVEFAMRMKNCGRSKTISLTHLYWA